MSLFFKENELSYNTMAWWCKGKVKVMWIYIASIVVKPLSRSGMDHIVLPANNTMPASTSYASTIWRYH